MIDCFVCNLMIFIKQWIYLPLLPGRIKNAFSEVSGVRNLALQFAQWLQVIASVISLFFVPVVGAEFRRMYALPVWTVQWYWIKIFVELKTFRWRLIKVRFSKIQGIISEYLVFILLRIILFIVPATMRTQHQYCRHQTKIKCKKQNTSFLKVFWSFSSQSKLL